MQAMRTLRIGFVRTTFAFVASMLALDLTPSQAVSKDYKFVSPEILVLGDSQLSFGSGPLLLDFFQNFSQHCQALVTDQKTAKRVGGMRTTMLGIRATSLQSWVTTKGAAHRRMCEKDKTWGVNTSVWGHNSTPKRLYYQMGEGSKYQICKRGKTPLQAMLRNNYYTPELVFFYLIGNGSERLANDYDAAVTDVKRLARQLPMHQKCIFMATTPIHTPRRNAMRGKAETNLRKAFAEHGNRCTFISAFKPEAIKSIQGKAQFFRRKASGRVKDPFHPNEAATRIFLNLSKAEVCQAVVTTLAPMVTSDTPASPRRVLPRVPEKVREGSADEASAPPSAIQATQTVDIRQAISSAGAVRKRK